MPARRPCRDPSCLRTVTRDDPCPDHSWRPKKQKHRALDGLDRSVLENPATKCMLCGSRKVPPIFKDQRWAWHHVDASDPDSRLVPAHAACNSSLGDKVFAVWRKDFENRIRQWKEQQQ